MSEGCTYDEAYRGQCGDHAVTSDPPRCDDHAEKTCVICDKPATHECAHTSGLVCGFPLCADHDLSDHH